MKSSAQKLHRYVGGWLGLMATCGLTLPIAMGRVSQAAKFSGQPVKSHNCQGQRPSQPQVVSWLSHCSHLKGDSQTTSEMPSSEAFSVSAIPPVAKDQSQDRPILRQGMQGTAVFRLQQDLHQLRMLADRGDGIFGPDTFRAVSNFQQQAALPSDGVVGPNTWQAIERHVLHPSPAVPAQRSRGN